MFLKKYLKKAVIDENLSKKLLNFSIKKIFKEHINEIIYVIFKLI